ncbi:uncharacterized protein LOC130678450 [Microplitis mediator]|uniref:uncharacterized protein LOC130678450 n=1 Tax=Microplitis mediator TaxID=375433 RepID=UPI002557BDC6|nr:uncharacterized protein LOC130678450 [Microplitis mediator]
MFALIVASDGYYVRPKNDLIKRKKYHYTLKSSGKKVKAHVVFYNNDLALLLKLSNNLINPPAFNLRRLLDAHEIPKSPEPSTYFHSHNNEPSNLVGPSINCDNIDCQQSTQIKIINQDCASDTDHVLNSSNWHDQITDIRKYASCPDIFSECKKSFSLPFIVNDDLLDLNNLHQLVPLSQTENNETIKGVKDDSLFYNRECVG